MGGSQFQDKGVSQIQGPDDCPPNTLGDLPAVRFFKEFELGDGRLEEVLAQAVKTVQGQGLKLTFENPQRGYKHFVLPSGDSRYELLNTTVGVERYFPRRFITELPPGTIVSFSGQDVKLTDSDRSGLLIAHRGPMTERVQIYVDPYSYPRSDEQSGMIIRAYTSMLREFNADFKVDPTV
ncbi:hypothetical protein HYU13_03080 [Candidatus Woesearchaeota archaeon]|nr:hypothetical protein [Candidatus Woesearchaeota archaeon]